MSDRRLMRRWSVPFLSEGLNAGHVAAAAWVGAGLSGAVSTAISEGWSRAFGLLALWFVVTAFISFIAFVSRDG